MRTPGHDFELAVGLLPHRGAAPTRPTTSTRSRTASPAQGEQEYNIVTVKVRRSGRPAAATPRTFVANASCGLCGKTTLDDVEQQCAAGGRRADASARSVVASLPERLRERADACSTPPAGSTPRRGSRPTASWSRCARTSAGTTRSTSWSGTRSSSGELPLADDGAHGVGAGELRDRAEGGDGGDPDRVRGVGAVEPGGRRGASLRPDPRGLRARRQRQRVHAIPNASTSSTEQGARGDCGLEDLGEDQVAQAAPGATCGSGSSRTASARRSPTTTRRCSRRIWENRDNLPYAWRILNQGVCDGCALGVAGFHDWTLSGVHLCTTRLNLLRMNTMGALDHALPRRRRAAAAAARPGAARPRPPRPPDGAAARRAGVHPRDAGTRRST